VTKPRTPTDGTRVIPTQKPAPTPASDPTWAISGPQLTNPRHPATIRDLPRYFAMVGVEPGLHWPDAPREVEDEDHAARYRLLSPLGTGGIGEVLLAWDADLHRHVAFKRLQVQHRSDPVIMRAFIEEAIITARLEHPHIVPIHDIGVSSADGPYYTMKRLRGEPLSAIMKRLRAGDPETERLWPLAARVAVFVRVLRAIAHAHAQGVVHCDLKPSNILVGDLGEVTVVDWGLAIALGTNAATQARALMWSGSPGYMAPEQSLGAPIEALGTHTDIWALGANLYELISLSVPQGGTTGRFEAPPDSGDKDWAKTWHPVIPFQNRKLRESPQDLIATVMKALAFEETGRHPSVLALLDEVLGWLEGRRAEERREADRAVANTATLRAIEALALTGDRDEAQHPTLCLAVRAALDALVVILDDHHAETREVASGLYWAMVRALHAPTPTLAAPVVALLREALDRLAELGVPVVQGGDIDAWYAAMERLADEGLPRIRALLERVRLLRKTELFAGLDGHALRSVAEALEPMDLAPAQAIFSAGDRGDALYVLAEGDVSIDAAGRHLALLSAPACFGEVALVAGPDGERVVRTAGATARTLGRAFRLEADRFDALAIKHGAIALGVMRLLATRLRAATERELAPKKG